MTALERFLRRFLSDVLFLAMDLLSGKSIPVLVAIARLPLDQVLVGNVLMLGAVAGVFYSVYGHLPLEPRHPLVRWNLLLQNCAALFFSLSLALALGRGIQPERAVALGVIPAFCLVAQPFPSHGTNTACLVALLLVVFLLPFLLAVPAVGDPSLPSASLALLLPYGGLSNQNQSTTQSQSEDQEAQGVLAVLGRCVQIFVPAFYACIQQAPAPTPDAAKRLAASSRYALLVGLVAAWVRVAAWYFVCFYQNNSMHVMLEDANPESWNWGACAAYAVILLYSACWNAAAIRERLLPQAASSRPARLKCLVAVLALAALFRQRVPDILLWGTAGLASLCLLVTAVVLAPAESAPFFARPHAQ